MVFRTAFTAALTAASIYGASAAPHRRQDDLASRIDAETTIALQGVENNIGPDGSQAPGAFAGVVIASPSTENPNCKGSVLVRIQ